MSSSDRRQFPRVQFFNDNLDEVKVEWPESDPTSLLDLSYKGMAIEKPTKQYSKGERLELTLDVYGKKIGFDVEVMWVSDKVLGVYLHELSPIAQKLMHRLLHDRLKGLNLRPIDKKFYSDQLDCSQWYQSSDGTNVFLWLKPDGKFVQKLHVDYEGVLMEFFEGSIRWSWSKELDQFNSPGEDSENAVNSVLHKHLFAMRLIGLLSHLPQDEVDFFQVFEALKKE